MTMINFQTELYTYDSILRSFAYNLVKNKEECEDLIQDTFYRALANRDKFAEGTNIKAWLFTIMKNIFINNYRKKQKQNRINDISGNQNLLINDNNSSKNDAELKLLKETIQTAINQVNDDFTGPFLLYYNGFKYQEIADQLSLPLGTVKSRIYFARKEIQSRLKNLDIDHSQI